MNNQLLAYLNAEKKRRNWSYRFMAQKTVYSHTQLANIFKGVYPVSFDFCVDMAKLFGRHPAEFLALSGILPEDDKIKQAMVMLSRLDDDTLDESINYLKYLSANR